MRPVHIISCDVHCKETEGVVMTMSGRVTARWRCATTIPKLLEKVKAVPRPRRLVIEEGAIADWLYRNLRSHVDEMVVSEPRRNRLIAKESDKDDPIDAEKMGHLLRGGYVKAVHHPASLDRSVFKQHVVLYHNRVSNRVKQANLIMALFRRHGVFLRESAFADVSGRSALLQSLPSHRILRAELDCLWTGYDAAIEQVKTMRRLLIGLCRKEPQVKRFIALPGIHWIRAATFFVYVDTPWRFRSKSALWKYLGIGLERRHSGAGPVRLRVPSQVNRSLKSTMLGAALSAVASRDNPFADIYRRSRDGGLTPRIARRNVARSQSAVMWGMWKTSSVYRPEWVGATAASL